MPAKPKKIADGLVVVFEGVDGVGKTTQLQLAQKTLEEQGFAVHATRNLGGTPIGEELRQVAFSSVPRTAQTDLYISAAIQEELARSIDEVRAQGKIILVDRGPLSFAAYHIYGNGVTSKLGWQFADEGMGRFRPEVVILYTMDLAGALQRVKRRAGHTDYYANKPANYFQRVEKGYGVAAKRYQEAVQWLDASQSVTAIHNKTMEQIQKVLAEKRGVKHKHS